MAAKTKPAKGKASVPPMGKGQKPMLIIMIGKKKGGK